jgi:hypothetical protein
MFSPESRRLLMEPGSLLTLIVFLFKLLIFPNLILKIVLQQKSLGPDYQSINAHTPNIDFSHFTHAGFFIAWKRCLWCRIWSIMWRGRTGLQILDPGDEVRAFTMFILTPLRNSNTREYKLWVFVSQLPIPVL